MAGNTSHFYLDAVDHLTHPVYIFTDTLKTEGWGRKVLSKDITYENITSR